MIDAFSVDCFFLLEFSNKTTVFYINYALLLVKPLIVYLILFLANKTYDKIKKINISRKEFIKKMRTIGIIVAFFFQPQIVKESLQMFYCVRLGPSTNEQQFLAVDPQIECWNDQHFFWAFMVALPSFLLWGILMPIFLYKGIQRRKKKSSIYAVLARFSFIVGAYKEEMFFWEFIITIRKILLIMILVFLNVIHKNGQIQLTFIILVISLMYHQMRNPFKDPRLNRLEFFSLLTSASMSASGLYFASEDPDNQFGVIIAMFSIACMGMFLFTAIAIYV